MSKEMFDDNITPEKLVGFLNNLIELDSNFITSIFQIRIPCNKEMAEYKTVQVRYDDLGSSRLNHYRLGLLGLFNGMFGVNENEYGCICMSVRSSGVVDKFYVNYDLGMPNKINGD